MVAKPKGVHSATEKPRYGKLSKLPPRFAKQREQMKTEKAKNKNVVEDVQTSTFMPKIENWDNELANNIPIMPQVINPELKQEMELSKSKSEVLMAECKTLLDPCLDILCDTWRPHLLCLYVCFPILC